MATYWEIVAYSAYDMFPKYKYLIVYLVFSHLGFWIENYFRRLIHGLSMFNF